MTDRGQLVACFIPVARNSGINMETPRFSHTIYGLRVDSTHPLPGVRPASGTEPADVVISLEGIPQRFEIPGKELAKPWYEKYHRDNEPIMSVWQLENGAFIRFRYSDGTHFVIDRAGTQIWAQWPAPSTLEDTVVYLLGPVLGFLLRLRGVLCLHASVMAIDGQAFALLGPMGAGKSTTAAAMARRGCGVLSEDMAPVLESETGFRVQPGYGWIRLWPQSSAILFGSGNYLPRIVANWDKCYLDLAELGLRFETQEQPLTAIYLLERRVDSEEAPFVEPLVSKEALVALVTHTYTNYLLDREQRAQEFETLGRLMGAVRMRRVVPHAKPEFLDRLCELILKDFREQS
jgi:hypothetical protein